MTMIELQDALAQAIQDVTNKEAPSEERARAYATAEAVARLAKQMINNADVILRTDKLSDRHDRIDKVVG